MGLQTIIELNGYALLEEKKFENGKSKCYITKDCEIIKTIIGDYKAIDKAWQSIVFGGNK